MNLEQIYFLIEEELKIAKEQWPVWPPDMTYGASIVMEEAGELVKEVNDYSWHHKHQNKSFVVKEAIQTAAMAIRFLENL